MTPCRVTTATDLARAWMVSARWIEAALESSNNTESLLDVYDLVSRRPEYDLWICDTAAMVTVIQHGQKGRYMHVWLAGGDMVGVQALYTLAEAFARALGCGSMLLIGRRGWERSFLRDLGWAPTLVHMEKRL